MDIAKWLSVVDQLCVREFPREHVRTDVGTGGPGYLIAELQTSGDFYEDDGSGREETEAQYEADRDGLGALLTERWGAVDRFSLHSVFVRAMDGEDIDEPWRSLSNHVPDVHLWTCESGRWIGLAISQWDAELPLQLLAIATDVDPH
ncbi:hypothetical protein [Streptomyces sp. NBC_00588]|uniref:hypothetical protein n=1 Tax=Streptomyces sp. NBC_00588 TaxID=2975784 RepID=UPI002E80B431|nr:hypothetical protein [Streptomyces sp. NBC_00588]WUB39912.1 hypothetical protein OHN38_35260 [Streptomyces sp. NBC_00588]